MPFRALNGDTTESAMDADRCEDSRQIELFNKNALFYAEKCNETVIEFHRKDIDGLVTSQINSRQWLKRFNPSSPQEDE